MKTVQAYLKILDEEKLIRMYISRLSENFAFFDFEDIYFFMKTRTKVRDYIERLKNLEIWPTEDASVPVLYAYKTISKSMNFTENGFCMIHLEELKKDVENANDYAYEFQNQEEIVGYFVSNASYTQENIYELIVDVMYEASFFGYENEHLDEERESLNLTIKEFKEGKGTVHNSADEALESILSDNTHTKSVKDLEYERLKKQAGDAISRFDKYSKILERKKLLESL